MQLSTRAMAGKVPRPPERPVAAMFALPRPPCSGSVLEEAHGAGAKIESVISLLRRVTLLVQLSLSLFGGIELRTSRVSTVTDSRRFCAAEHGGHGG